LPFSKITLPFLYDFLTNVFTNSAKPSLLKGNSLLKNKNNLSVSVIFIVYTVRFGIIATNGFGLGEGGDFHHKCSS
jgi:hypothetical protein